MDKALEVERSLITTFRFSIYHPFISAISDYSLISENDKIAVCISGGKDSFLMAKCFQELSKYSSFPFECIYLLMDPGYSKENIESIKNTAKEINIPLTIFKTDIFKIVDIQKENKCYICAKMRRGALYSKASELGCNKIALGHHYDDVIETTLMSIFYSGSVETMLPILESDNYKGLKLIRPLYYVREKDIIEFEKTNQLNFLKNGCFITKDSSLCSQSKRQEMKKLISSLEKENDAIPKNIFNSMDNINLDKVLGYKLNKEKIEVIEKKKK